jgi:hypothetical protein
VCLITAKGEALVLIIYPLLFISMGRDHVFELWPPTGLLFIPQVIYEYGESWWNDTDRKTEEIRVNPVPVPPCPQQIPHELTCAQTQSSAVRGHWLTAGTMARPHLCIQYIVLTCCCFQ